jgi:tetratricopeptide (TPR) repeat protein
MRKLVQLTSFLTAKDKLALSKLTTLLDKRKQKKFFIVVGYESSELKEALQHVLEKQIQNLDIVQNFRPYWLTTYAHDQNKTTLIILDSAFKTTLDDLMINRDYMITHHTRIVLLLSFDAFDYLQDDCFDLFSVNNFAHKFYDHLYRYQTTSTPEKLDNALVKLKNYQEEKKQQEDILMRLHFNVAREAQDVSQLDLAIKHYQEALAYVGDDQQIQAAILGNIGLIYRDKGDLDQALRYHQEALKVHKEIGYLQGEASDLGNIGLIYRAKGDLDQALRYHQEALKVHKEIGYLQGEANQLGNIGLIYHDKGDLDQALRYLQEALSIAKEIEAKTIIDILEKSISGIKGEMA